MSLAAGVSPLIGACPAIYQGGGPPTVVVASPFGPPKVVSGGTPSLPPGGSLAMPPANMEPVPPPVAAGSRNGLSPAASRRCSIRAAASVFKTRPSGAFA